MNICPVVNDTARYYAELDRADARAAAIERRADELIGESDLCDLIDEMGKEDKRFRNALAVLCQSRSQLSRDVAAEEIRSLMWLAAYRLAEKQLRKEADAAEDAAAADYWERRRCEDWA